MKAYKFTQSKYHKKGSLRLGSLWDYRKEELHGSSIGDKREGSFQIEMESAFELDASFQEALFSNQNFMACYVKGDRFEEDGGNPFLAMTIPNIHIFSASLIYNKKLFNEFESDLCLEIPDFRIFSELLVRQINKTHRVLKWVIVECLYMENQVFDRPESVPCLTRIKNDKYAQQKEVRLCVELLEPPDGGIVLKGKKALKHCHVFKRLEAYPNNFRA